MPEADARGYAGALPRRRCCAWGARGLKRAAAQRRMRGPASQLPPTGFLHLHSAALPCSILLPAGEQGLLYHETSAGCHAHIASFPLLPCRATCAGEQGLLYYETSAKANINVTQLFEEVADK